MNISDKNEEICPICLQRIEPDDDVIEEGEKAVHLRCHTEPNGQHWVHLIESA